MQPETALWHALEYSPTHTATLQEWQWHLKDGYERVCPFLKPNGAQAKRWPVLSPFGHVEYFNLTVHSSTDIVAWHEDGRRVEQISISSLALLQLQVLDVAKTLCPHYQARLETCSFLPTGAICISPSHQGSAPVYLIFAHGKQQLLRLCERHLAARPDKGHILIPSAQHLSPTLFQLLEKQERAFSILAEIFHHTTDGVRPIDHIQSIRDPKRWPSPIPPNTHWKDVTIQLDQEGKLQIRVGKVRHRVTPKDIGLTKKSAKTHKPTTGWLLLLNFIHRGVIYADDLNALNGIKVTNFKSALRSLRDALSAYFPSIPGDPLPVKSDKTRESLSQKARTRYEPAFSIEKYLLR